MHETTFSPHFWSNLIRMNLKSAETLSQAELKAIFDDWKHLIEAVRGEFMRLANAFMAERAAQKAAKE